MDNIPGGGSLGNVQQYFEGVDFPLNKEDAISAAENNGAPEQVVNQLQERLPEGEISGVGDITGALGM